MIESSTIKVYLEKKLNRVAKPEEIENAKKDSILLSEYILDELEKIKNKIKP